MQAAELANLACVKVSQAKGPWSYFIIGILTFVIQACTTYEVRTTDLKPADNLEIETPEELLLDVGIEIFEPEIGDAKDDEIVYINVRESESVWVAQQMKQTLEITNAWGVVRVIPDNQVITDLRLNGTILQSDGETLALYVTAKDMAGKIWLNREYRHTISKYAYDNSRAEFEPFQGLYNEISNDLLALLKDQSLEYREDLRTISAIRFAQSFSPEAFNEYVTQDNQGQYSIQRLPADNDPMLNRIRDIQLRDHMFVDVLQDYYVGFTRNMDDAYWEWRSQSYKETQAIRELERSAAAQRRGGWVAIVAGIGGLFDDNAISNVGGSVAIYGGVVSLRSGYTRKDEASMHVEMLNELGQSLETELEPSVIELQDRTVTLTGTVRDQYDDWRGILQDIYYAETGYLPSDPETAPNTDSLPN